ncbi:hypothetical protein H4S01_002395 [Coemansia sp. RSA 2610]|nr:hypothetical protein H4S01_002395 [Coemansia sp. RSA 2610]
MFVVRRIAAGALRASVRSLRTDAYMVEWTPEHTRDLVAHINAEYRGRVTGNWDLVVDKLQRLTAKHHFHWSCAELKQLEQHVQHTYLLAGRLVDWTAVAARFGRTPGACYAAFTRTAGYLKLLTPPVSTPRMERRPVRTVSDAEVFEHAHALRQAVAAHTRRSGGPLAVDWDAIAGHLKRPVVDVLLLAQALQLRKDSWAQVALPAPATLRYPDGWDAPTLGRLRDFVHAQFGHAQSVDWDIVALYMGVDSASCASAHVSSTLRSLGSVAAETAATQPVRSRSHLRKWTADEHARLDFATAHRTRFRTWDDVARFVGNGRTRSACISAWSFKRDRQVQKSAQWTRAELQKLESELLASGGATRLSSMRLAELFPNKSREQVRAQLRRTRVLLEYRKVRAAVAPDPQRLVDCCEAMVDPRTAQPDWHQVSAAMGISPAMCRKQYHALAVQASRRQPWSKHETQMLRDALDRVNKATPDRWEVVAQLVGSRTPAQCLQRTQYLDRRKSEQTSS